MVVPCINMCQDDLTKLPEDTQLKTKQSMPTQTAEAAASGKGVGHQTQIQETTPDSQHKEETSPQIPPKEKECPSSGEPVASQEPLHDAATDAPAKDEPGQRTGSQAWPESWAGQGTWQDWGNTGWSDWTWGGGWSACHWTQQPLPEEQWRSWRRRADSFDSCPDGPGSCRRAWSYESVDSGSGIRKASSLDSELMTAFQRLDTVDRTSDKNLHSLAMNLDKKFADADSPDKSKIPTPSTTTPQSSPPSSQPSSSQQGSPDKEPKEAPTKAPESEKLKDETKIKPAAKTQIEGPNAKDQGTETEAKPKSEADDEAKAATKAAELAQKKKAAHARYMRYWRSVHGGGL